MERLALLALAVLAVTVLSAVPDVAGEPAPGCRPSCNTAKRTCVAQVTDQRKALLRACAGSSAGRKQCRQQVKSTARAARDACGSFMHDCRECCGSGGPDCSVGCGDGVVTSASGEQCDPPGARCDDGTACDAQCHCPAAATTTSTTVTSTTLTTTTTGAAVTTTTHQATTTTITTLPVPSTTTTTQPPTTSTTSPTTTTTTHAPTTSTTASTTTIAAASTTSTTASTSTTTIVAGCHLPATGQTTCSNGSGTMIACAGTGQDGDLRQGAPLSYTDNGDGTITDDNTGLVWEKLGMDGSVHDAGNTYTWDDAFVHVAALNGASFAGHNDWRLPNVKELESIVDYGTFNPSVAAAFDINCTAGCAPTSCSCTNTTASTYWSSTSTWAFPSTAWYVDFFVGAFSTTDKTVASPVRAVRGSSSCLPATGQTSCWNSSGTVVSCAGTGQDGELRQGAALSYTDNGDGTITDDNTGLVWEKLSLDGSVHDERNTYTWSQAFSAHVATLNGASFAGHGDWRLPNVRELGSIANYQSGGPEAVSTAFNTGCTVLGCSALTCSCTASNGFYWSSSSEPAPASAWLTLFDDGSLTGAPKSATEVARAVRGGS